MKKMNKGLIISTALFAIPLAIGAYFYSSLPQQMAIHFDASNTPDNFAPKVLAVFGLPLLLLVVHLFSWFRVENDPKRANGSVAMKVLSKWAVPIISIIGQIVVISYSMDAAFDFGFYATLIVGVLIIFSGNYLPKSRQNYTIGIRLPWTLSDENNWNKTHQFAGIVWVVCGFILIGSALLSIPYIIFGLIVVMILAPIFYSYAYYKKHV